VLKATQTELEAGADPPPIQWNICDDHLWRPFGLSSPFWRQSSFWVAVERHRAVVLALNGPPPRLHAPAGFASVIVADLPVLFAEFRWKRFTLLLRGNRDGFGARDFHGRCDSHSPTLTLIQDKGDIFGCFTPVEWESWLWNRKPGSELQEFPSCAEDSSNPIPSRHPRRGSR
jgi:hypothetical protein